MTDAPEWEDAYHPQRILHSGNAPKGWSDEFRFAPYIRADIAAAREAELRAEVERLQAANREAAMQSLADLGQAQEALERAVAAEAEVERLRALLDEAREAMAPLQDMEAWAENAEPDEIVIVRHSTVKAIRSTLAKIGGQHD